MCHLKALQKKGLIHREPNMSRAIQLLEDSPTGRPIGVKMVGRIAAGQPIEAIEQHDELTFSEWTENGDKFALRVSGDSMIEEHIADGDFVIIKKQEQAQTARSSRCGTTRARPRSRSSTAIRTGSGSSRPIAHHEADFPRSRECPGSSRGSGPEILRLALDQVPGKRPIMGSRSPGSTGSYELSVVGADPVSVRSLPRSP